MTPQESRILEAFPECRADTLRLLLAMRTHVLSYLPAHDETIRWGRIMLYKPDAKTTVKDCICSLQPKGKRVYLVLHLGALLEDPHNLLQGNYRYKREIPFSDLLVFQCDEIQDLILQSYYFDSKRVLYTLLPSGEYEELRRGI